MNFPDYEAAAKAMWLMSSAPSAQWVPLSSAFKDRLVAKATVAVDAALGDKTLYRLTEHTVVLAAGRGEFEIDGTVLDVWPLTEENNDG